MIGDSGLADGDFINGGGEGFSAKLGELGWGESRLVRKLLRFSFSVRRESRSFIRDCLFKKRLLPFLVLGACQMACDGVCFVWWADG